MAHSTRFRMLLMFSIGMVLAFLALGTTAMALFYTVLLQWFPNAIGGEGVGFAALGLPEFLLQTGANLGASLLLWRAYRALARNDAGAVTLARVHGRLTIVLWVVLGVTLLAVTSTMGLMIAPLLVALAQVVSVLAALPIVRRTAA